MNRRTALLIAALLAACAFLSWVRGWHYTVLEPWHQATASFFQASPPGKTVVLVVVDTVRADHLSVCGYEHPTSPVLASWVDRGASLTCEARAPGSWTVASHASFFTGEMPLVHKAELATGGDCEDCFDVGPMGANPLGPELPVLAEQFAERGYQNLFVSANPVVSEVSGLARGFHHHRTTPSFFRFRGPEAVAEVRHALRWKTQADKPLFLFVNLSDTHDPLVAIPAGHPFLPPRGERRYSRLPGSEWVQLIAGELSEDHRAELLEHWIDLYDHGVWTTDKTLGAILDEVERLGWTGGGLRLVVVSDHGEYLGEHDLFEHALELYEPQQRVPLMVYDSDGSPTLPDGPINALHTYHLTLDGTLPERLAPVTATASRNRWFGNHHHQGLGSTAVATEWQGQTKLRADGSAAQATHLGTDPDEQAWHPADPEDAARIEALWEQADALDQSELSDADMVEMLKAAGYLHDDE